MLCNVCIPIWEFLKSFFGGGLDKTTTKIALQDSGPVCGGKELEGGHEQDCMRTAVMLY